MTVSDRRRFMKQVGSLAAAGWAMPLRAERESRVLPSPVGYSAIAWPRGQFDEALKTISQLGFKGVQMLGWTKDAYAAEKADGLKAQLARLKLKAVALSCHGVRLDPARPEDHSALLRDYCRFFQSLGGMYLQVTDGGRPNHQYTRQELESLGRRMNALGKQAQDFGLTLGYHPHFNTIGETREGLGRVLDVTDPRYVKLIADVGHLMLGGADPAEVIRTYHERLIYLHFKDVRKDVAELARKDHELVREKEYHFCEIGTGAVDFPRIVQALRDVRFPGWIIVELDGNEPPPGGPAESARINKGALQRLGLSI